MQKETANETNNKCDGTIEVKAYTRQGNIQVSAYTRSCPYHKNGNETGNKEKEVEYKRGQDNSEFFRISELLFTYNVLSKLGFQIPEKIDEGMKKYKIGKYTPQEVQHTWNKKAYLKPNQKLVFNGKSLQLFENSKLVRSWKGSAGESGHQVKIFQYVKDKGPLPEGAYLARQERFQKRKDETFFKRNLGYVGRGTWKGGAIAWGNARVWLEPSNQTFTNGRTGFTIHGGYFPSSAGCIDLTRDMDDFASWFEKNKADVIVRVKYD